MNESTGEQPDLLINLWKIQRKCRKIALTLKWRGGGVPKDPRFVFRAFYYFHLRFFDRYFFIYNCLTIGYASFDAINK